MLAMLLAVYMALSFDRASAKTPPAAELGGIRLGADLERRADYSCGAAECTKAGALAGRSGLYTVGLCGSQVHSITFSQIIMRAEKFVAIQQAGALTPAMLAAGASPTDDGLAVLRSFFDAMGAAGWTPTGPTRDGPTILTLWTNPGVFGSRVLSMTLDAPGATDSSFALVSVRSGVPAPCADGL